MCRFAFQGAGLEAELAITRIKYIAAGTVVLIGLLAWLAPRFLHLTNSEGLPLYVPETALQPEATVELLRESYDRLYLTDKWHCFFDMRSKRPKGPQPAPEPRAVEGQARYPVPARSVVRMENTVYVEAHPFRNSSPDSTDMWLTSRRILPISCRAVDAKGVEGNPFTIDQAASTDLTSGFLRTRDFGNIVVVVVQRVGSDGLPPPPLLDFAVESSLKPAFEAYIQRLSDRAAITPASAKPSSPGL